MNRLVLGLLRGDEGKGKITDYFAKDADLVVRYAGSCNAGHTIYKKGKKIVLHQIPSGILQKKECLIGRGCLVDLKKLWDEIQMLKENIEDGTIEGFGINDFLLNYIKISYGAHLIFKNHIEEDTIREDYGKGNGSTKCGIAPAYRDKYYRTGIRVFDLKEKLEQNDCDDLINKIGLTYDQLIELSHSCFIDDEYMFNVMNSPQTNILFEGAQGVLLDINSPYYPNVSSSSVGIDGVIAGTGINYNTLLRDNEFQIIGIAKVYMSSVGIGKFLTEISDENVDLIRNAGNEYGATTGRPRKIGWFDLPLLKYAIRTSGADVLCLTRLDTLMEAFKDKGEFKVCTVYFNGDEEIEEADIWNLDKYKPRYETFKIWKECSLSDENFKKFIEFVQENISIPIKYVSIGQNENDIITLDEF